MSYADQRTWLVILAAALVFVGLLVFRVHGLPRALGGARAASPKTAEDEARIRWLDQFSFIGLGLVLMGLLLFATRLLVAS